MTAQLGTSVITKLQEDIQKQIKSFSKKATRNRRIFVFFRYSIGVLGLLVTILLGYEITTPNILLKNIALIFSAIITFLTAIEGSFKNKSLWIQYTVTENELKSLSYEIDIEISLGGSIINNQVLEYKKRFQSILDAANEVWVGVRKTKN